MKPQRHKRADRADESLCSKYCAVRGSPDPAGRSWRNSLPTGSQLFLGVPEVLRPRAVTAVTLPGAPERTHPQAAPEDHPQLRKNPLARFSQCYCGPEPRNKFSISILNLFSACKSTPCAYMLHIWKLQENW